MREQADFYETFYEYSGLRNQKKIFLAKSFFSIFYDWVLKIHITLNFHPSTTNSYYINYLCGKTM